MQVCLIDLLKGYLKATQAAEAHLPVHLAFGP